MKLSFSNLGCPDWDLDTIAKKAAEYGYDGVELRSHNDNPYMYPNPPLSHRRHVKSLFDSMGIKISCVSAYSAFADTDEKKLDENRQILIDDILLARDLGAKIVRSFLGQNPELTNGQIINAAAPYLNYCADIAEGFGVKVCFETHDVWCKSEMIKLAFSKITSKGAAVLWDVGNNHFVGESVSEFFGEVGDRVAHIHLKDGKVGPDGNVEEMLPGEGTVEMKACLDTLVKAGFDGYISFEWEKRWHPEIPGPEVAFPRYIEHVKKLIGCSGK